MSEESAKEESAETCSYHFVQATIDALSAHIAVLDEQGSILTVNRAWREFARAQQFIGSHYGVGQNYLELCGAARGEGAIEAHEVAEGIRHVLQGMKTEYFRLYPCDTPAEKLWYQLRVTRFVDNGRVHAVVTHENVSEVHQAQEILQERESFLRMLLSSVDAVVWALNAEGTFTFVEGRTLPIINLPPSELVGHSIFELLSDYPEVLNRARRALRGENFRETIDTGELCFEVRYTPLRNNKGQVTGAVGIGIDITHRKRAEEALQKSHQEMLTIWESMSDAFFAVDHQWHFTYVNSQAEIMLHHRREELLGRKVWDVFPLAIGSIFYHEYHRAFRERTSVHFEADYAPFDLWVDVCAYYSEVGLSVYMRDITQRKKMEDELRRSNEILEARVDERTRELRQAIDDAERSREEAISANRAKTEFLSRMSHELRTPLNAILGFGQLLDSQKHELSPRQVNSVQQILHGGRHLLGLINEILDISRVESGKIDLRLEEVSLHSLLYESLDLIHPIADNHGIHLKEVLLEAEANSIVLADRQRLKQVLLNLLSNAVKYNRPGGSLTLTSAIIAPDRVRVAVIDTGYGLSNSEIEKLFIPFERLDAPEKGVPGTGLGLAVSKSLVEHMNGIIGVESTSGQGSTFFIEIPLVPEASESETYS